VGIVTLFSMLKIWNEAFWKKPPEGAAGEAGAMKKPGAMQKSGTTQKPGAMEKTGASISPNKLQPSMFYPVALLAFSTVVFGLFGGWFMDVLQDASEMLKQPDIYIHAVLK
jgi:multicomponent Na+:H+ antiporter subunit D